MDTTGIQTDLSDLMTVADRIEAALKQPLTSDNQADDVMEDLLEQGSSLVGHAIRIRDHIGDLNIQNLHERLRRAGG